MYDKYSVLEKAREYTKDKTRPSIPLPISYMEELEIVWGKKWGAQSEIGKLKETLVQRPDMEVAPPEEDLPFYQFRSRADVTKCQEEHDKFVELLKDESVRVHYITPPLEWLLNEPYGVYHARMAGGPRDPGFVVNGGAIIGHMSLPYRRGEEFWWAKKVMELGCPILYTLHDNGTFEGGNVVWLDPTHVCIGRTARTNQKGIDQVSAILRTVEPPVEEIRIVSIPGWLENLDWPAGGFAHLDCVFGYVDDGLALVYPAGLPYDFIEYLREKGINMVEVPPEEAKDVVCNIVALEPGKILFIAGYDKTQKKLEKEGVDVIPCEYTQLAPLGGGPHCATGPLIREPGPKLN
ncbi:dimethylarginine dimethylaminohydrolase family protein [Thermoproteota archaeon]